MIVALALFVTTYGSATDVGLVLGAQTLPFVVFLLIGGVWADRLPRAQLMIATDVVRAAARAAALIFTDVVEIWHRRDRALFGTAEAFFRPAYTGLLPRTVPEPRSRRRGLSNMTNNLAELTAGLAPRWCSGWAPGGHSLAATSLTARPADRVRVATRRRPPRNAERWSRSWRGLWHVRSVVAVGHRGRLRAAVPLANAPLFVLGPTVAEDSYDSAALFGIVITLFGAGAVAAHSPAAWRRSIRCARRSWCSRGGLAR